MSLSFHHSTYKVVNVSGGLLGIIGQILVFQWPIGHMLRSLIFNFFLSWGIIHKFMYMDQIRVMSFSSLLNKNLNFAQWVQYCLPCLIYAQISISSLHYGSHMVASSLSTFKQVQFSTKIEIYKVFCLTEKK